MGTRRLRIMEYMDGLEIEHFKMLIILGNIVAIHKQVILCICMVWYCSICLFMNILLI